MPALNTISAHDAKAHFGEFLESVQHGPMVITKNNRPVAITISIADASDTLISEMFMEREAGYDEWFAEKVGASLQALESGMTTLTPHENVFEKIWVKMKLSHPQKFA
jgi:prevent-host-death family protein